ncbi:MAG: hypothetical protein JXR58_10500 [Bacteroidales bacterium]|nr:hypothetical protein [Bacteroidales bacterium]
MKKIFLLILIINCIIVKSQSDLLIAPFRVVFEDGKTIEEVSVANTGKDTARYTISFLQYKMEEDGVLKQIEQPEEKILFADKYLRIFPRSIVLAPNESQIVRLQVKTAANMLSAEYRSHLYFRSVVDEKPLLENSEDTAAVGIKLIPVYGISIPVIIRLGELAVTASIDNVRIVPGDNNSKFLHFDILRSGEKSTFGQIEVFYVDVAGKSTLVGKAKGVAVYTPLLLRKFNLSLAVSELIDFSSGSLKIVYSSTGTKDEIIYFEHIYKLDN